MKELVFSVACGVSSSRSESSFTPRAGSRIRDIFLLELAEIFAEIGAPTRDLATLVLERRARYAIYAGAPAAPARFTAIGTQAPAPRPMSLGENVGESNRYRLLSWPRTGSRPHRERSAESV